MKTYKELIEAFRYRQKPPMTPEELDNQTLIVKKRSNPSRKGMGKGRPAHNKGKSSPKKNAVYDSISKRIFDNNKN